MTLANNSHYLTLSINYPSANFSAIVTQQVSFSLLTLIFYPAIVQPMCRWVGRSCITTWWFGCHVVTLNAQKAHVVQGNAVDVILILFKDLLMLIGKIAETVHIWLEGLLAVSVTHTSTPTCENFLVRPHNVTVTTTKPLRVLATCASMMCWRWDLW